MQLNGPKHSVNSEICIELSDMINEMFESNDEITGSPEYASFGWMLWDFNKKHGTNLVHPSKHDLMRFEDLFPWEDGEELTKEEIVKRWKKAFGEGTPSREQPRHKITFSMGVDGITRDMLMELLLKIADGDTDAAEVFTELIDTID